MAEHPPSSANPSRVQAGTPSEPRRSEHALFVALAAWFVALVLFGFARTFFFRTAATPLPAFLAVHGLLFATWTLLQLLQTLLAANGRLAWHRRLGLATLALLLAMISSGFHVVLRRVQGGFKSVEDAAHDLTLLGVGVALALFGIAQRRRPHRHKRLMLFATLLLTSVALDRVARRLDLGEPHLIHGLLALAPGMALVAHDAVRTRAVPKLSLLLLALAWVVVAPPLSEAPVLQGIGGRLIELLIQWFPD